MLPPSSPHPVPPGPPPLPPAAPDDYADSGARAIDLTQRPVADSLREIMASSPRLPRGQPPPLPPAGPPFRNRHGTLAFLGLLHLAAALAIAGETVWHLVVGGLDGLRQDEPERARLLVENPWTAAWGLAIGIGLIFARRWARQLFLAEMVGTVLWALLSALAITANNAPDLAGGLSAYDQTPAWQHLAVLGALAAVAWLLHALLAHRNVGQTCAQAQPTPDWTDRRSPAERLLLVTLVGLAGSWAGLASYHAWPCWGVWRFDHPGWVWGGAAWTAALAAMLVGSGRQAGVWIALGLVTAQASSIAVTALHQPVDEFANVWDAWCFNQRGGLVFSAAGWLLTTGIAVAALRAQHRRRHLPAPPPPTTPPTP
jgi:hypothetical protein